MAEVTINNSPIHSDSILTAVYGETGPNWSRFHTGTDFAPYGSTPANPDLYSVCNGIVENIINYTGSQALGNQVIIKDNATNNYWRYCHMNAPSPLTIGQSVTTSTKVGVLGSTGNVTGPHLHLEYSRVAYWDSTYTNFLNPSDALGIPNQRGTIVKYNGSIIPPEPEPESIERKRGFNWRVFTKNVRNRRGLDI